MVRPVTSLGEPDVLLARSGTTSSVQGSCQRRPHVTDGVEPAEHGVGGRHRGTELRLVPGDHDRPVAHGQEDRAAGELISAGLGEDVGARAQDRDVGVRHEARSVPDTWVRPAQPREMLVGLGVDHRARDDQLCVAAQIDHRLGEEMEALLGSHCPQGQDDRKVAP